jgi:hypothetical protein
MPETQNEFKGWAKVEVMGHQSHIGYVTTEAYGQAVMFRIDQPAIPEEERTLAEREYTSAGCLPVGTIVKQPAIEGVSVLVGSGSIYRIIPCTEAVALKAVRESQRKPLVVVSLPDAVALPAAKTLEGEGYEDAYGHLDDEDRPF